MPVSNVSVVAIVPIHSVVVLHRFDLLGVAGDHDAILLGRVRIASLIDTTCRLVCTSHVSDERSLLIGLVNHAELVDDAASSAYHGSLVLLEDQCVDLAAVLLVAPVLLHVFLRFA